MSVPEVSVEVFYDGVWNTVPAQDLDTSRSSLQVGYGVPDSHGEANPTDVSLPLENPDRKWSPKDPLGELFEKIGTGTPLRPRIGDPQVALSLPGVEGSFASTPDTAVLDITGDIDIRVDVQPASWRPAEPEILIAKTEGPFSWAFSLGTDGKLSFDWTTDGTLGTRVTVLSTAAVSSSATRLALRVTLDVNNGAAGKTTTFYTAPTIAGSWTLLGSAVITAGTTSIFSSSVDLAVGAGSNGAALFTPGNTLSGRVFAAELRNGIGGTLVAAPDFSAQDPEDDEFTDSVGLVWTVQEQAALTDPSLRGSTEMTKFAPSWDRTTRDARMTITGLGLLNSLGIGEEPLRSSLFRDVSMNDAVVAYWPMEDASGSTTLASGKVGHPPMSISGSVSVAGYNGFACSQAIPTFSAPSAGASYASGVIPIYVAATEQRVIGLLHVPDAGVTVSERAVWTLSTTGTAAVWVVEVLPAGTLKVTAYSQGGVELFDSGTLGFAVNGTNIMLSLLLVQNGANIDWQLSTFDVTGATGAASATLAGNTFGRFTIATVGPSLDLAGSAVGQLAVINGDVDSIWDLIGRSLVAWAGETAGDRLVRLTGEAGIELRLIGDPVDTALMGPQGTTALMSILDACAAADGGWFGERRDRPGLLYRTRTTMYNQTPALELDMADGHISNPFAPPLDDQVVRNDITVSREGGTSYRAVQQTGPNNIQSRRDDPQGIGRRYTDSKTLNLYSDDQLSAQATWRLWLGTVDEHRIASLEIEMEHHPELLQAVLELEGGGLIRISNPPPGLPPGPLDLIALGWNDTITDETWHVQINCMPGSPWQVAVLDDTEHDRLDTAGSELATSVVEATTALEVATTQGAPWITTTMDATAFPFTTRMGGETCSITAIANHTVAFVGVGTAAHADNASVSPGLPSGWAAGNLLLLLGSARTGVTVRPTGYRLIHLNDGMALYARIAGVSESAPSLGISGGAAGSTVSAQMVAFSGVFHSTEHILADNSGEVGQLNQSGQDIAYPPLKVWIDNCLILYLGSKLDDWTSVTSPGTEIGEPSSTIGNDQGIVWAYQIQTTHADVAAGSFTVTGGATAVSRGSTLALRCDVQAFTGVRSANEVSKPHSAGTALALDRPAIVAL